jgi:hypothetical protein
MKGYPGMFTTSHLKVKTIMKNKPPMSNTSGFRTSSAIMVFISMISLASCSMKTLKTPYGESIARNLKKGDVIEVTMSNGDVVSRTKVEEVWRDSLRVASTEKPIRVSEISVISKRKVNPWLTVVIIVVPVSIVVLILASNFQGAGVRLSP